MSVVCRQHVVVLALADKSALDAWCLAIRCHLGCGMSTILSASCTDWIATVSSLSLLVERGVGMRAIGPMRVIRTHAVAIRRLGQTTEYGYESTGTGTTDGYTRRLMAGRLFIRCKSKKITVASYHAYVNRSSLKI